MFLFLLFPFSLFGQEYLKFPSTYDSEGTAKQICSGTIKKFLSDHRMEGRKERRQMGNFLVGSRQNQLEDQQNLRRGFTRIFREN